MRKILKNGKIVLENQVLENCELVIENGRIAEITASKSRNPIAGEGPAKIKNSGQDEAENAKVNDTETNDVEEKDTEEIDVGGAYIMPGIIDIHSDMIESFIQPRSTAVMDFAMGLREAERVLMSCGITTMFHSISMFREGAWDVKEIRQAPQVRKLAGLVGGYRHEARLIRHRYHLRYEIDNIACYDDVMEMIQSGVVDLLSFMDHTPGQGQYKNLEIYRRHQPNEGRDLTEKAFQELIGQEAEKEMVSFEQLMDLADCARKYGIKIASHDDDTVEKLKVNQELGVTISEFPITMEVAEAAVESGLQTVLGAPNILLGGSHSGNLSALEAINAGAATVLVSDYYPQALLQAVFRLYRQEGIPLFEAVRYVTLNPAKAVGMERELGSIEAGKKADILCVKLEEGYPQLNRVFVDGECIMNCQYRKAD
ncbi:alpha-D-ribose 1-methylphosphonate 5-triphosphate diphosphatase [Hespellia stercorisuis]|uniref:Alpha-D-ribose 1-methylphosphonate 5-triphosphate diphosphatase n=1 Tax=Hespellia stercorisuis DSM 15480 TaxID=1121950 RepID=A0A1M6JVJ3_9FIRM|nr:alpha-D-ribose 1-methylphosphonate 5-triphosphate diphosphatase [Hespellia stercorisuis]SHJ50703.1 alpha-D-ribose 1-methylphosphonate 5-triphosphate diphosphatase [Hespellia stercorisuis DSM 15480]